MKLVFRALGLICACLVGAANADADVVLAFTSFENDTEGSQYVDTGDASVDHDLVNNVGQSVVDSDNVVGDLGFDAAYVNTRGGVGLTDGDFVGATSFTGTVGAFTDGVQGYQISDPDGRFDLIFDTVNIAGQGSVDVSMDFFVADTGFESTDTLRIFVDVDGVQTDLLNIADADLENRGTWENVATSVTGSNVFLGVEFDSNSGAEALFLDNVVFSVAAIPEPGSAMLIGLAIGGIAMIRRRK